MKRAEKIPDLNDIFDQNVFGEQFLIYLGNRIKNPQAVWDNMDNENLQQEFIAKCQFIQHYARTKLGIVDITMELAATTVNNPKAASFRVDICEKIFNGFMHFISVNEKNPAVLASLMDTWVAQGRSLEEIVIVDELEFTPLNFVIAKNNLSGFVALAQHGVDVTQLDSNGFSELHKLTDQVEQGTSDISMLEAWVKAGIPSHMIADGRAGKLAGKTAVQMAQDKGLVEVTKALGGNVELALENLDKHYEILKGKFLEAYYQKTSELQSTILKNDLNKLLLHYLVENFDQIPLEVFQKFIADESLGIKTNILGQERITVLESLVIKGLIPGGIGAKANQFALILAKHGIGTTEADNGTTLLSYTINHGNDLLFDYILENHLNVLDYPGKIIEKGSIQIFDSPLANALLCGNKRMTLELVKHGFTKCTVIIPNKGEVEFGLIQSIKAFGSEHLVDLVKAVSKYVDMKSEVVVQEMVNALMTGEAIFVKALVDNGADINYNNGELLKLFVGAGKAYLPAVKLAIQNGAKITEEINILSVKHGTTSEIAGYVDQEKASKPLSKREKMKLLLTKLLHGDGDEEIASSFPGEENYVKIASNCRANQVGFKALCKMYGVTAVVLGFWKNGADQPLKAWELDKDGNLPQGASLLESLEAVNFANTKGSLEGSTDVKPTGNIHEESKDDF